MPRAFSSDTLEVYWWLWRWPWASAADIARVTGLKAPAVTNVLKRGKQKGWFLSARLGRVFDAVDRYVVSNDGVEESQKRWGWERFWWHTADGVRALARRLEVVEMAYGYLPVLWQSNAVTTPKCHVFRERVGRASRTGEPVTLAELVETDWSEGKLVDFHWWQSGPFEAVATYTNENPDDGDLLLPVLWRGNFQKPGDIAGVRRDMDRVLVEDERWSKLSMSQALFQDCHPGMVIFCPDRVAAAVVQRNLRESATRETMTKPAILDAQGQVVRAMSPPTAQWRDLLVYRPGWPLKDIPGIMTALGSGAYAAVNGKRSWRTFRSIDASPGVTLDQIAASVGVSTTEARRLLEPMLTSKVITVRGGGHYLDASGRGLLAASQRKSPSQVKRRWGVYSVKGGEYLRAQRLHNQGQAQAILELRRHGYGAYPAMGVAIDHRHGGWFLRVVPDGFVVLRPGVLVALEFERSARTPRAVEEKAEKYKRFDEVGRPIPVLFITETAEAAKHLSELRCPFLLATTLDAVREGPHGRAIIEDGVVVGDPGCWWYWYANREAPTSNIPIDMCSQLYVQYDINMAWRLPLDEPLRLT